MAFHPFPFPGNAWQAIGFLTLSDTPDMNICIYYKIYFIGRFRPLSCQGRTVYGV